MTATGTAPGAAARFRAEYGAHRAAEGRGHHGDELFALPYLTTGPLARQWSVRARSFDAFMRHVIGPASSEFGRPLDVLDLGAGNGWLSRRVADAGHRALAADVRDDAVDGLGAAAEFVDRSPARFARAAASFDALPLMDGHFDVAVFNAALHYALDLPAVLREAARTLRPGGWLAIVDSPFYARDGDGAAMVAEKRAHAAERFGGRADVLLSQPFIEYLTADGLRDASADLDLRWHRHRVAYPLWYEVRPLIARLRRRRAPSRFDLWVARTP
ncbi:MAG TPA: class I SAM-dependent methyltransferase [Longimicrobiaceae bacterium]|nr:class I SAM-dependent methyltransferase [Longimicrobiaceae bacterium]